MQINFKGERYESDIYVFWCTMAFLCTRSMDNYG